MTTEYTFKVAETEEEIAGVERLNHETFATELGQHTEREDGRLQDRFHERNRYFIALSKERVVGMVAVHDEPPFSIEKRLPAGALDEYPGRKLEIRLLALRPEERHHMMLGGLLTMVFEHVRQGYEWLLISGVAERLPFYRGMGFRDLGPPVEDGRAAFAPMILNVRDLPDHVVRSAGRWARRQSRS